TEMLGLQRYPKTKLVPGSNFIPPYDMTAWSLPLLMGVEAERRMLAPDERKSLRGITETDWPQGAVRGGGSVYALGPESNNSALLMNAFLKNKGMASIAKQGFTAGGVQYPAGTVLLEGSGAAAQLASKFHLQLTALPQKPNVPTAKLHETRVAIFQPTVSGGNIDEGWTR